MAIQRGGRENRSGNRKKRRNSRGKEKTDRKWVEVIIKPMWDEVGGGRKGAKRPLNGKREKKKHRVTFVLCNHLQKNQLKTVPNTSPTDIRKTTTFSKTANYRGALSQVRPPNAAAYPKLGTKAEEAGD